MDNLTQIPLTLYLGVAGAAIGTTTTTTIANTNSYCIKGKAYSKTAASNGATPTLDSNTGLAFVAIPVNKASVHVLCLDSGGTIRAVQGTIVDYTDAGVFSVSAPQFPTIPDTLCPFAYELTKVISTGSAWTMGVSNQATLTGVTHVFVDCVTLPERPQVS